MSTLLSKVCGVCHRDLPAEAFHIKRVGSATLRSQCKECASRLHKQWVDEHRLDRGYLERIRQIDRTRAAASHAANPALVRMRNKTRRARIADAQTVEFDAQRLSERMAFFGFKCWMCGGPFESIDHVKPLSRGGAHMLSNMRPACLSDNSAKQAKWYGVSNLSRFVRS